MGSVSIEDALKVGALIEETDIRDLKERLEQTDNEDVKLVFQNLLCGSENHLRAFIRLLKAYGIEYSPQVLSQEEFDEIVNTDSTKCGLNL